MKCRIWWLVLLLVLSGRIVGADTPVEALVRAFNNASAATHTRSDLTYTVDDVRVRQVLTRVRPDRTQLVVTPPSGPDSEAIVIGNRVFSRQGTTWTESQAPADLGVPPNPVAGLETIFSTLTEGPRRVVAGRAQRVFAGSVRWQAGRNVNEGTVEVLIDADRTLPTRTAFTGTCGGRRCTFTQSMDFSSSLTITSPTF